MKKSWGFSEQKFLSYDTDLKFRCQVTVTAESEGYPICLRTFPNVSLRRNVNQNDIEVGEQKIALIIPLSQPWHPTKDSNQPHIYFEALPLFLSDSDCGEIGYALRVLIVKRGRTKMFVPEEYDWGDGFAWIGGRPESNRRRF